MAKSDQFEDEIIRYKKGNKLFLIFFSVIVALIVAGCAIFTVLYFTKFSPYITLNFEVAEVNAEGDRNPLAPPQKITFRNPSQGTFTTEEIDNQHDTMEFIQFSYVITNSRNKNVSYSFSFTDLQLENCKVVFYTHYDPELDTEEEEIHQEIEDINEEISFTSRESITIFLEIRAVKLENGGSCDGTITLHIKAQ